MVAQFEGHPGIISVTNFFPAHGTAYLVMEYLEGTTLKDYLKDHGGRLAFNEALDIMTPVMDALREVHRVNVLHRDISPDNIYVTTPVRLSCSTSARRGRRCAIEASGLSVISESRLRAGRAVSQHR